MNADPIAGSYRWLEYAAFGFALERARFDFLSHAATGSRVLILGEGDGRFLARLLKCNPQANVTVIETSARMIRLAQHRVPFAIGHESNFLRSTGRLVLYQKARSIW